MSEITCKFCGLKIDFMEGFTSLIPINADDRKPHGQRCRLERRESVDAVEQAGPCKEGHPTAVFYLVETAAGKRLRAECGYGHFVKWMAMTENNVRLASQAKEQMGLFGENVDG